MMSSWPSSLPQLPYINFDTDVVAGLTSVPNEMNNPLRTRTYPEHEAVFSFKQLTSAQLTTLKEFYDIILNQTAAFSADWLVLIGYNHHFLRFLSPPRISKNERFFDIQISVEIISSVPIVSGNIEYWV
jgi:hypothetical protein